MTIRPLRLHVIFSGNLFLGVQLFLIFIDNLHIASYSIYESTEDSIMPNLNSSLNNNYLLSSLSKLTKANKEELKTPRPRSRSAVRENESFSYNLRRNYGQPKLYHKNKVDVIPLKELDCMETHFMSPFHYPVKISLNTSIYDRADKTCSWNFIGTELCIPLLSCDTSNLTRSCDKEYLEIVDGVGGSIIVCGGNITEVKNVQASGDLRDLYIHYKVIKSKKSPEKDLFSCNVKCSKRGEGTPLDTSFNIVKKWNPNCFCGTKPNEDRIMNGEDAKKFEFPWLVAFVETNTRQPFCGGSIINNRFVQTAGHCIKGKFRDYRNIQVVVNGHVFDKSPNANVATQESYVGKTYPSQLVKKMDRGNGSARYNVEEIIVHPLYVAETNDFDIALVKLSKDIDLSFRKLNASMESILQQPRQVCLPPPGSYLRTYAGKKAMVAGWGLPHVDADTSMQTLQKLEVNVFAPKDCKQMFEHRVNRRMVCAGYKEGLRDSCAGDSGGPLMLEDRPKVWYQIASVSFGEGCGEEQHPGVYFRTTEGVQWLIYHSNYHATRADEKEEKSATWCMFPP